jgi:hypothetical protein
MLTLPASPPGPVVYAAAKYLRSLALIPTPHLALGDATRLTMTAPHQIYALSYQAAQLSEATPVGWRFLVSAGGPVIAAAEVAARNDGQAVSVHFGPLAAATDALIRSADQRDDLPPGHFELRLLKVSSLHLVTAWLVADRDDSAIVPLRPTPRFVSPDVPLTEAQFLATLRHPEAVPFGVQR